VSPAASAARARVARVRSALPTRARLTVLTPPASTRWRPPFAAACAAVLVASLLGVLVLNIVLARGAYDEHVLELRQIALTEREQELSERLSVQASPAVLSARARDLGMVPNANPAFIRLEDGTVLGSPTPAGDDVPLGASIPPVDLDAPVASTAAAEAAAAEAARVRAEQDRRTADRERAAAPPEGATTEGATTAGDGVTGTGTGTTAPPEPAVGDRPVGDGAVGDGAVVQGGAP
jgi:hypothetical protein